MLDPHDPSGGPLPDLGRTRSPAAIRVDNLIRQRLRIGDPRDPASVAEGLRKLFPGEARAQDLESTGLAALPAGYGRGGPRVAESAATGAELAQAAADVDRDLQALAADHRLKDISAELQGWGQAIRPVIADGASAARLALDPRARDRVFAARRQLGDYARLARFVGALTATMNGSYRKLAKSLDEVAGLLLVLAGESLAGSGLGGGRFLLSVPASELQARRDSVLSALRTLQGTVDVPAAQDQWPWGLHGLREVLRLLEASGHLDLRALLEESVLGGLMDQLIERAGQSNVLGLRALGATADLALHRLHRLLHMVDRQVNPQSPAVTGFLKSIQLFLDAFRASRSGYRLLFVGRAPIAFYGLGGIGGPDTATQRLLGLVIARGRLAEHLDCYLGCECCEDEVVCQVILDKLLYDTDRAIDLYVLGSDPDGNGEPEWRAAAFGHLVHAFMTRFEQGGGCLGKGCTTGLKAPKTGLEPTLLEVRRLLLEDKGTTPNTLDPAVGGASAQLAAQRLGWVTGELCMQKLADERLPSLLATLAPGCVPGTLALARLSALLDTAIAALNGSPCAEVVVDVPPTPESSLRFFGRLYDDVYGNNP